MASHALVAGETQSTASIQTLADWFGPPRAGQATLEGNLTRDGWRQYIFFHSGEGVLEIAGTAFPLEPGSFAVIPSGVLSHIRVQPGARGIIMGATETFLRSRVLPVLFVPSPDHWRRYALPQVYPNWRGETHAGVRDGILEELERAAGRLGGFCDAAVIAYAFVITGSIRPAEVAAAAKAENSPSDMEPAQLLMRFHELIEQNFRNHLSIEAFCERLGVTPVRLSRACKAMMDRTPLALIHERIIVEAKGELGYTFKSVSEIAYGLGFGDAAYFNRFFKQQTGETPLSFRRSTGQFPGRSATSEISGVFPRAPEA